MAIYIYKYVTYTLLCRLLRTRTGLKRINYGLILALRDQLNPELFRLVKGSWTHPALDSDSFSYVF